MKDFNELMLLARKTKNAKMVVVGAEEEDVLKAVNKAKEEGVVDSILVGNKEKILNLIEKNKLSSDFEIINTLNIEETLDKSLSLFKEGKAHFIMKGLVDTSVLMKAVLDEKYELRTNNLFSHLMLYSFNKYHKIIGLTDGGMNISPDVSQKRKIINNALMVYKALGYKHVNIAGLCAKEKPSKKMQATIDAHELMDINDDFVTYEGPIAMDLVFDKKSAITKGYKTKISENVDLLLVPFIEVGNAVGKMFSTLLEADSAGIIIGAKVPIVLVSRADSMSSKLYSIALAKVFSS